MAGKGSSFERDLCRKLTQWWLQDPEVDVIFWRTATSGGRATSRAKKSKNIAKSHCGDICALDHVGAPLLKVGVIEAKKGYNRFTISDILDKPSPAKQMWENWIAQAQESQRQAGSLSWFIISRRDSRATLISFPHSLFLSLRKEGAFKLDLFPFGFVSLKLDPDKESLEVSSMPFDNFLKEVSPRHIISLASTIEVPKIRRRIG